MLYFIRPIWNIRKMIALKYFKFYLKVLYINLPTLYYYTGWLKSINHSASLFWVLRYQKSICGNLRYRVTLRNASFRFLILDERRER